MERSTVTGLPHTQRWTGTPATSPQLVIWSKLELNRPPSGSRAKSLQTELQLPQCSVSKLTKKHFELRSVYPVCSLTTTVVSPFLPGAPVVFSLCLFLWSAAPEWLWEVAGAWWLPGPGLWTAFSPSPGAPVTTAVANYFWDFYFFFYLKFNKWASINRVTTSALWHQIPTAGENIKALYLSRWSEQLHVHFWVSVKLWSRFIPVRNRTTWSLRYSA